MASITQRERKGKQDGYQATVRIGKISKSKTFESRDDAEKFAAALESRLLTEQAKVLKVEEKARAKKPSLFDYVNEPIGQTLQLFHDSPDCSPKHRHSIRTVLKHLDDTTLGAITPKWVKRYIQQVTSKKVPGKQTCYQFSSVAKHLATMSVACKWRAEQLELPPQPSHFSTKHFPKLWEQHRIRRLSKNEQEQIERTLGEIDAESRQQWISLFHLALETGARLQELVGAEYDEVQMDRRIWTIPANRTKSKKERVVPLSREAMDHFERLLTDKDPYFCRFFHWLGSPPSVSGGFRRYAQRAGLVDFRFHDLRHEAISRMVLYKRKLSVFEIMAIVGHTSTKMLMRYANLRGEELVERMD